MLAFVRMALSAVGYRATARALEIVGPMLPGGGCSANGGQAWLLRLGLYELTRPKPVVDDWLMMIDHTIQTGDGKCLVVVGIRVSDWDHKRRTALEQDPAGEFALKHEDLSVFAIEHMSSSTAVAVHERLEAISQQSGIVPCGLLCDQGADVRGAAHQFAEGHGDTPAVVHDIAHGVANALKRQLNKNPAWEGFLADANRCKTAIRQTPYAFLMPPELKNKARWMNLEPLIDWSRRVRHFLEAPQEALARAGAPPDLDKLERKMGWLRQHAASIQDWATMLEAAAITLKYVRNHGYHDGGHEALRPLLCEFDEGAAAAMVAETLQFVQTQCEACGGRRMPGSTEVLESLIGKGKQLMGRNKNGYTKSVLTMASAVLAITAETVQIAFQRVKTKDVWRWAEQTLGLSLQSQRQRAIPLLNKPQTE